jgi:hypothetical protein
LTWTPAASCSVEILLPTAKCSGEIWLPLHNTKERFDSPLHGAAGSQTSIQITPQIWKKIWKKLGYESGSKVGTFDEKNWKGKSRASVPLRRSLNGILFYIMHGTY